MPSLSHCLRSLSVPALALLIALAAAPGSLDAAAPHSGDRGGDRDTITIDVDDGQTLHLSEPAAQVFVANPDIADIQAPAPTTVLVLGKKPGRTALIALDANGAQIARYRITVQIATGPLKDRLAQQFPTAAVQIQATGQSVILTGKVMTPSDANAIVELAKAYIGASSGSAGGSNNVVNQMTISAATQVHLRVYIAEVSRTVVSDFGINWETMFKAGAFNLGYSSGRSFLSTSGTGLGRYTQNGTDNSYVAEYNAGGIDIAAMIDILASEGLATVLAEPTLTTLSGQTASFLAGGEYPIPIYNNDQLTVEYKKYGVSLNFTPTVYSADRIGISVKPEVSELTTSGEVTLNGYTIPALTVRRMDTTVELASGQSFAIAGLLSSNLQDSNSSIPGLGDIPILGKLFQSKAYQNKESELVVLVTPYLVEPADPSSMAAPSLSRNPNAAMEHLLSQLLPSAATADPATPPPHLYGPAGFAF
ncbi:MAG: type II and III secretion system protein family protein [Azospirillaceae bacterium]|nr:type II and III secretion system protein family protein [Azospirillaceae bacterium]